jgi:cytochrome oxidase Cu insertion factor (SCO1/SenC/PrrC family)
MTVRTHRAVVLFILAAALAGVSMAPAFAQYDYDYTPPEPGTYSLPPIQMAGDGRVIGADGKAQGLHDIMKGHVTVLSFIYTRCPDPRACPFASGVLYDVHKASKHDRTLGQNLQLLTFSFDPAHDTPSVMADYGDALRSQEEGCEWKFLTTAGVKDLDPILEAYGQRVDRRENPGDGEGAFFHLVRVYLVDRDLKIRNIYSFGLLDPRLLMADVHTLLKEEDSQASTE